MTTTHEIQPGRRIDLAREVVGLDGSDRLARLVEQTGRGPQRIDGFTVGAPRITGDAPHDGEVHPDGDELRATGSSCRSACGTRSRCGNQASSSTSRPDRTATAGHSQLRTMTAIAAA
jgi:hypothetical protein